MFSFVSGEMEHKRPLLLSELMKMNAKRKPTLLAAERPKAPVDARKRRRRRSSRVMQDSCSVRRRLLAFVHTDVQLAGEG